MTATTIRVQMAQRKDTAANWTAANPILLSGELGYETDTKKFKIGNGSTNWNSLTYLPIPDGSGNLTITGNLEIGTTGSLTFEGSTADGFETTLAVTNPTADRTITLPNQSGTVLVSGNASIVDADIAANAEIAVSKLADGAARQLLQTDAAGTGVEWTNDIDVPGTLDVTSTATFDSIAQYPAGSAAAPTITFTGDANTGIYSPGADQLAISTGGSGRLFVNSNGDVNVGHTSSTYSASGRGLFSVNGSSSSLVDLQTGTTSRFRIFCNGTTTELVGTEATGDLVFGTNSQERLRITSAGLVGIGTSSPGSLLNLYASSASQTELRIGNGNSTAGGRIGFRHGVGQSELGYISNTYTDFGGGIVWHTRIGSQNSISFATGGIDGAGETERLRISSSGNVGIGTTTPGNQYSAASQLVVGNTSASNGITILTGTSGDGILNFNDGDNNSIRGYIIYDHVADSLRFGANGSERARLTSSGQLLVGTSSTSEGSRAVFQGWSGDANGSAILKFALGAATPSADQYLAYFDFTDSGHLPGARFGAQRDGGTWSGSSKPSRLVFSVTRDSASSPTEALRISNTGAVTHSCNRADWGLETKNQNNSSSNYGISILCGTNAATGTNYAINIADGDGDNQGYVTFTGGTVTYGAFTAHHPCILPEADNEAGYPYGTLLETTSIEYTQKDGHNTERGILYNVRKTQAANSRAVLGAYGSSMNGGPNGETNRHQALVLGDGHILCNNSGGNIKIGDGICSSATPGIGQKATATPSMAIGIAQEDVTFADDEEVKLVAVQYGVRQFIPWGD